MRQAETALRDGRLDEAFELAQAADVREHRRGQDLIGRLARALAQRGNEHLTAGRLTQASADCERAAALGGNLPEVAALKAAVVEQAATRQDLERRKAGAIAAAREHLRNGELSIGGQRLESVDDTCRGEMLREELAVRREQVEGLLARAEEAVTRTDWTVAVEVLVKARELHSTNARLVELIARVNGSLLDQARSALNQGRLDQARCMLGLAGAIGAASLAYAEARGALDLCVKSANAIRQGQCRRAIEILQRLRAVLPEAAWVNEVLADAQRAAESVERLRGGALGLLMGDSERVSEETVVLPSKPWDRPPAGAKHQADRMPVPHAQADAFPRRFMLHVDGVGSFLVVRERCVTLGSAGGSAKPDVPLLIDASVGPVTIERVEDDYFLACPAGATVNNAAVTRKLLVDGDRIGLSPRCHARFAIPNAASTSAVLSIAGARMPGTDATRVILLSESLVIGPGSAAHVRTDGLAAPAILHVRDGRLFCNASADVTADGHPVDRQAGLPLGVQLKIGPVSMVIRNV
jgi:tetratricopeptide (TPR) repeat protein